jgi:hypothetical protein
MKKVIFAAGFSILVLLGEGVSLQAPAHAELIQGNPNAGLVQGVRYVNYPKGVEKVEIRRDSSRYSIPVGVLVQGEKVTLRRVSIDGKWFFVDAASGKSGWVNGDYLTVKKKWLRFF